jgi:hypothetical protein
MAGQHHPPWLHQTTSFALEATRMTCGNVGGGFEFGASGFHYAIYLPD